MKKYLLLGLIILAFVGCKNQANQPGQPEQPEQSADAQLVKVTIDFRDTIPANMSYLVVSLDSAKMDGGGRVEDIRFYVYPEDFIDSAAVFYLNAAPKFYEIPIVEGRYTVNLVAGLRTYEGEGMPELDLKQITNYSQLIYKLDSIVDTGGILGSRNAFFSLVSGTKKESK